MERVRSRVLNRRQLLLAGAGAAAASVVAPQITRNALGQPTSGPLLTDVHCHVFNIHDLPAAEFLVNCTLREKVLEAPDQDLVNVWKTELFQLFASVVLPAGGNFVPMSNRALQLVLTCVKEAFARETPTAQEEMAALANGAPPVKDLKPDEFKLRDVILRLADLKDDEEKIWIGSARKLLSASMLQSVVKALSRERHDEKAVNAKLRDLLREAFEKPRNLNPAQAAAQRARAIAASAEVARLIYHPETLDSTDTKVVPYVQAAMHITHSRQRILQTADDLFRAVPPGASGSPLGRNRLFCPAIVDYQMWLRGVRSGSVYEHEAYITPQSEQIEVMAALSRRQPADRWMHGFAAFDPLRQAVYRYGSPDLAVEATPEPLSLLRDAVMAKGFVGAKLYPPMGFLPMGNAQLHRPGAIAWTDDGPFGSLLSLSPRNADQFMRDNFRRAGDRTLGAMLDEALHALYGFCSSPSNDVAIMAHCSRTQGAFSLHYQLLDENNPPDLRRVPQDPTDDKVLLDNEAAARRSDVRNWIKLLRDFPQYSRLRINIGHAGGIWCLGAQMGSDGMPIWSDRGEMSQTCDYVDDRGKPVEERGHTWIEMLIRFLDMHGDQYPNVYADISDWTDALEPETAARASRASDSFARLIEKCRNPEKVLRRFMYGTDWIVMGSIGKYQNYYAAYRREIEDMLRSHFSGRFGRETADDIFGLNAVRFLGLTPGGMARTRLQAFYGPARASRNWSVFDVPT